MRTSVLLLLAVGLAGPLFSQSNEDNRWTLYQSLSWTDRLSFLSQDNASPSEDFLLKALDMVDSAQIDSGTDNEIQQKRAVALKVVQLLGPQATDKALPALERLSRQARDPIVKGQTWQTLAARGDKSITPDLVRSLDASNSGAHRNRAEEILAYAAVAALGTLKAEEGFRSVALASFSWYPPASHVRELALKTLPQLTADPVAKVIELLSSNANGDAEEGLFRWVLDQGTPEAKTKASTAVLQMIATTATNDLAQNDQMSALSLLALQSIVPGTGDPSAVARQVALYLKRDQPVSIKIQAVTLLGAEKTPAAIQALSENLSFYNGRQKNGTNTAQDLDVVRSLIAALGSTKSVDARSALQEARYVGYTPAVVRQVDEAIASLNP